MAEGGRAGAAGGRKAHTAGQITFSDTGVERGAAGRGEPTAKPAALTPPRFTTMNGLGSERRSHFYVRAYVGGLELSCQCGIGSTNHLGSVCSSLLVTTFTWNHQKLVVTYSVTVMMGERKVGLMGCGSSDSPGTPRGPLVSKRH